MNLKTLDFSALSEFLVVTRRQTISIEIERVGTIQNTLGSGPVWDTAEKALYWVDGTAAEIYRLDPRPAISNHGRFPPRSALSALREKDGAVLALENGFHLFDFSTGKATALIDPEAGESRTRFDDGKVDAAAGFVAGTLVAQLGKQLGRSIA